MFISAIASASVGEQSISTTSISNLPVLGEYAIATYLSPWSSSDLPQSNVPITSTAGIGLPFNRIFECTVSAGILTVPVS